jgi:hypothetical protein
VAEEVIFLGRTALARGPLPGRPAAQDIDLIAKGPCRDVTALVSLI